MSTIYKSEEGYKGFLYGSSSFAIYDINDKMVFHTAKRNINTYEELQDAVDNFPDFRDKLTKGRRTNVR